MPDLIKSCLGDDTIKIKALPTIRSTLAQLSQSMAEHPSTYPGRPIGMAPPSHKISKTASQNRQNELG